MHPGPAARNRSLFMGDENMCCAWSYRTASHGSMRCGTSIRIWTSIRIITVNSHSKKPHQGNKNHARNAVEKEQLDLILGAPLAVPSQTVTGRLMDHSGDGVGLLDHGGFHRKGRPRANRPRRIPLHGKAHSIDKNKTTRRRLN